MSTHNWVTLDASKKFYVDARGNYWPVLQWTREEAEEAAASLTDCYGCFACYGCTDCFFCGLCRYVERGFNNFSCEFCVDIAGEINQAYRNTGADLG